MNRQQRRAAAKAGSRGAALFAEALRCYEAGQLREANRMCRDILALDPSDVAGLHLTGLIALQSGLDEVAFEALSRAVRVNARIPDLHTAVAEALQRLGRLDEALAHNRQALALDPHSIEALYNGGNLLLRLKRHEAALASYDRALAIKPDFAEALQNRGTALFELARYEAALADYDRALAIRPQFVYALSNRGGVLIELKRYEEALASCDRALAIDAANVAALANRGNAFYELRRFARAARDFEEVLAADPGHPYAAGKLLFCRLLYCDWTAYAEGAQSIVGSIAAGERAALPFMFLNLVDSPGAQLRCAQIFNRDKHPASASPVWRGERYDHTKIRVAYLSADFRRHPMAYLMAGVFETHDKSRFETIALSFGPDPDDEFRERLENSFDRFIDVRTVGDRDVALLLQQLEIDIAVDLMGYSNNSRPGIFAFRGAPVQVNFLGYAGTLGADCIDYLVADRFIVPEESRSHYAEKIVYLPDTYLPTDAKQPIAEPVPTRGEVGLPETGFVFCCFNNNYKIVPPIFDVWMRLLLQVEGSVLWLVRDNASAVGNLREAAARRGVAPERLVFAPRVGHADYLARLGRADLFLDTLPYNAHTTASDALWAGLPVVTCAGSSFASRVAGSLLRAVGLPELVTANFDDYAALALKLARDRGRLAEIRATLARNRRSFPLFDTERYCRHLESAYDTMWQRSRRGEPPASFAVAPIDIG